MNEPENETQQYRQTQFWAKLDGTTNQQLIKKNNLCEFQKESIRYWSKTLHKQGGKIPQRGRGGEKM